MAGLSRNQRLSRVLESTSRLIAVIIGGIVSSKYFADLEFIHQKPETSEALHVLNSNIGTIIIFMLLFLLIQGVQTIITKYFFSTRGYHSLLPHIVRSSFTAIVVTLGVVSLVTGQPLLLPFLFLPFRQFNFIVGLIVFLLFLFLTLPVEYLSDSIDKQVILQKFQSRTSDSIPREVIYLIIIYIIFWADIALWIRQGQSLLKYGVVFAPLVLHQSSRLWRKKFEKSARYGTMTSNPYFPASSIIRTQTKIGQVLVPLALLFLMVGNYYDNTWSNIPITVNIGVYLAYILLMVSTIGYRYYSLFLYSYIIGIDLIPPWYSSTVYTSIFVISVILSIAIPVGTRLVARIKTGSLRGQVHSLLKEGVQNTSDINSILQGTTYEDKVSEFVHIAFQDELIHEKLTVIETDTSTTYILSEVREEIIIQMIRKIRDELTPVSVKDFTERYGMTEDYFHGNIMQEVKYVVPHLELVSGYYLLPDLIDHVKEVINEQVKSSTAMPSREELISAVSHLVPVNIANLVITSMRDNGSLDELKIPDGDYLTSELRMLAVITDMRGLLSEYQRMSAYELANKIHTQAEEIRHITSTSLFTHRADDMTVLGNSIVTNDYVTNLVNEIETYVNQAKLATIDNVVDNIPNISMEQLEEYIQYGTIPEDVEFSYSRDSQLFSSANLNQTIKNKIEKLVTGLHQVGIDTIIDQLEVPDQVYHHMRGVALEIVDQSSNYVLNEKKNRVYDYTWLHTTVQQSIKQSLLEESRRLDIKNLLGRFDIPKGDWKVVKHAVGADKDVIGSIEGSTILTLDILKAEVNQHIESYDGEPVDTNYLQSVFNVELPTIEMIIPDILNTSSGTILELEGTKFKFEDPKALIDEIETNYIPIHKLATTTFRDKIPLSKPTSSRYLESLEIDQLRALLIRELVTTYDTVLFSTKYELGYREDEKEYNRIKDFDQVELDKVILEKSLHDAIEDLNEQKPNEPIPVRKVAEILDQDTTTIYHEIIGMIDANLLSATIDKSGTSTILDDLIILRDDQVEPLPENLPAGVPTSEITNINRDRFEKIMSRYSRIEISQLARLLNVDETALQLWLIDLPQDYGFTIDVDVLEINQDALGEHIDDLFAAFEEAESTHSGKLE